MKFVYKCGVLLLALLVIIGDFDGVQGRGRGGGARGGSRGGSSRYRSPSRSRSSSRSPSRPTVYKHTKMPVTSSRSPVIKTQTRTASRTSKYPKYIAAGAVTYYLYSNAPVYRGYYPMYGMHLRIPPERGIRVMEERQEIVDVHTNHPCYGVTESKATSSYTPATRDSSYADTAQNAELEKPANTTTKIVYDDGVEQVFTGLNDTEIDTSVKRLGTQINATTITDYDSDIAGTKIQGNCTRVITKTSARIIRVYDDNPNANSALVVPATSFLLLSILAYITYRLL